MQNSLDSNVKISDITPFYGLDDKVTAYCISFELDCRPSGYVLISLLNLDSPIAEFAFDGPGLVATINEDQELTKFANRPIRYLGAGALLADGLSANTLCDVVTKEEYPANELKKEYEKQMALTPMPMNDVDIAAGILDRADASVNNSSIVEIPSFGSPVSYWLLKDFSSGNVCSPTCGTNILWYWGVQRDCNWKNGNKTGFDLAKGLYTAMAANMGTVPPVGTADVFIKGAYKTFLDFRGTNYDLRVLTENKYKDFTAAIDDECPVHTMLRNESFLSTGHDVMTFGYAQSTRGTDYLYVLDGWYRTGRFVNFDYYPTVKGVKVWIGPTAN